jgi:lipid A ethanolaminephosphotransferase
MRTLFHSDLASREDGASALRIAFIVSLFLALLANWPLWRAFMALEQSSTARGMLFIVAFAGIVLGLLFVALALFAWARWIKPTASVFILAAAFGAHFMGTYAVVIDDNMMVNVLQTDWRETRDLLSWRMALNVLLLGVVPLVLLWRIRLRALRFTRQLLLNLAAITATVLAIAALVFVFYADFSSTMRVHKSLRYQINPLNSFYALGQLGFAAKKTAGLPLVAVGRDVQLTPREGKPLLMVLVAGETARSDHFSLNGYARETNPLLKALAPLSFREVASCGTSTATSLPCMFSTLGKAAFEATDQPHENLLDIAQRAGLAVLWVDNQSGCKGVCARVPTVHATKNFKGELPQTLCTGTECYDGILLEQLSQQLEGLDAERRKRGVLIVLHPMGSHGPAYYRRSTPALKPFGPECLSNNLPQCSRETIVNAYDNSIVYTDWLLAQTQAWIAAQKQYAGALMYVSDHGESLGEGNLYLHGLPYAIAPKAQKHVPWITWLSADQKPVSAECASKLRNQALSHDNLSHSVMGLFGIQSSAYKAEKDVFSGCR